MAGFGCTITESRPCREVTDIERHNTIYAVLVFPVFGIGLGDLSKPVTGAIL